MNTLYFGDNLEVLRESIADRSVDLVYLDPPFNSGANYNIIFQPEKKSAAKATAQIQAFEDTWTWSAEADETYRCFVIDRDLTSQPPGERLIKLMTSMREYLGETPMMAYLTMMAPRLLELRRVLKDTGSIYLHCDPTASHYLKLLMDAVFGVANYRNEIVWHYGQRTDFYDTHFSRKHDTILFYAKSETATVNHISVPWSKSEFLGHRHDVKVDEQGREFIWADGGKPGVRYVRFVDDVLAEGKPVDTVWDMPLLNSAAKERIGYPTQKPQALLERIIQASSNEGDVVLDPFCGCGTAVAAAQKLNRQWVGIDITYLSIDLIAGRLRKTGLTEGKDFVIKGAPADVMGADQLAARAPFQFQYWALSRIPGAMPSDRKTGDHGVDGVLHFWDPAKASKAGKGVISVKGTIAVNPGMVRDLAGTVDHQDADFGILVTLQEPIEGMRTEARKAGVYKYNNQREIPRLQLVSATDLFKEFLPLQLPPEEVRNGRKMTIIAEPGADEAKGGLFGE
ncbi:DNA methyltransferase [Candidatus Cryosericum odellii]|jgi:site-specific DNA-methyltransferase (adenine-specific)|uniref:Site-specific DNA-methyltransferase n=1 Tax=Candidatus Cryosericum odellii TaxID=2290917 RepID=A0A398DQL6_9BACT|nr:DNA methyltransferase [Candidatus Cryosericum odellii]RIE14428.1 site-specific DNA-methyltransferase [Candidatus Cryosericum odellii]